MKPVAFSKLAKREIDAAAQWFEDRKEGLGKEFYQQVDEAAEKIERNPEGFQKVHQDGSVCGSSRSGRYTLEF